MIATPVGQSSATIAPASDVWGSLPERQGNPEDVADRVAAVVGDVAGVAGLHTGAFGEVATHLQGRRVEGVQIRPDHCAVHVILYWGVPVLQAADRVRSAVWPLVGTRVDVTIEDVITESPRHQG